MTSKEYSLYRTKRSSYFKRANTMVDFSVPYIEIISFATFKFLFEAPGIYPSIFAGTKKANSSVDANLSTKSDNKIHVSSSNILRYSIFEHISSLSRFKNFDLASIGIFFSLNLNQLIIFRN